MIDRHLKDLAKTRSRPQARRWSRYSKVQVRLKYLTRAE